MEATLYMILMGSEIVDKLVDYLTANDYMDGNITKNPKESVSNILMGIFCLGLLMTVFRIFCHIHKIKLSERGDNSKDKVHHAINMLGQNVVRSFSPSNNCDVLLWRLSTNEFHANHGSSLQRLLYISLYHVYILRCFLFLCLRRNGGSSDGLLHHAFPSVPYLFDWLYLCWYIDKQIQRTMHWG